MTETPPRGTPSLLPGRKPFRAGTTPLHPRSPRRDRPVEAGGFEALSSRVGRLFVSLLRVQSVCCSGVGSSLADRLNGAMASGRRTERKGAPAGRSHREAPPGRLPQAHNNGRIELRKRGPPASPHINRSSFRDPLFVVIRRLQRESLSGPLSVLRVIKSDSSFSKRELCAARSSREDHRIGATLVRWG